ncbi:hypothetical protein MRX96_005885 [Rhipicephalus microplus]
MPRFVRATQRTRLLLVVVVAFTVLFICGVAEDNDRRAAVRSNAGNGWRSEQRGRRTLRRDCRCGGFASLGD